MSKQIALPAQVPGVTLQIVHDASRKYSPPWSISLYARSSSPAAAAAIQLAYVPAEKLQLARASDGCLTVNALYGWQVTGVFEISRETAEAIAAFAGVPLPQQAAA